MQVWSNKSKPRQTHYPPRLFVLPGKSKSGWTTRMCLVSASFRENVFSSVHKPQRTFCLRLLWIVSSCRVRSYEREKTVLHGLLVEGFIRSHLWGPAWLLRLAVAVTLALLPGALAAEPGERVGVTGVCCGDVGLWASRRCFWSLAAVSNRWEQPAEVHV